MAGRRIVATVALGGAALAASASASLPARPYTAFATKACLTSLPGVIVGLPPANPPARPALFVYSFPSDGFVPRERGRLGVWFGRRGGAYEGIDLAFFESVSAARAHGGKRLRNVVVGGWSWGSRQRRNLQGPVLGCLRIEPAVPAHNRPTPRANLATFAGYWGGHTRGLRITSAGRGTESASDGCCMPVYRITFRIVSVRGTLTRATAAYRLTSFKRYRRREPRLRVGRTGTLRLRNGIVTNVLMDDWFCSLPAWGATGACGA